MPHYQITHQFTGAILWTLDVDSYTLAVEAAVKTKADLGGADLRGAHLGGADLRGANLGGANLRGANLGDAKNAALIQAQISIVPDTGAFHGWKRCQNSAEGTRVFVHLAIPAEARRSNATGRKCRAEYVDVLDVIGATEGRSLYDASIVYRAGARISCHAWDEDRWNECSGGIHFYLTRIEAEHHE